MPKLVRITTVPISLDKLLTGQLGYMSENGFEVIMVSSPGDGIEKLEKRESSRFIPITMTRTISPLKDVRALFKLVKLFKELKPQIVHTHTPKAGLLGMMAAWIARVPIKLHTVAGLPLMESAGAKRKLLEFTERLTYGSANLVYPNSKKLEEFIIDSKFCASSKLKVIGDGSSNGINTNYFSLTPQILQEATEFKSKHNIKETDFVFIFVGRLVKDKGIEELVDAFCDLNKTLKDIKLLLVGPQEQDLNPIKESTITEIDQNPQIVQVGFQSDVRAHLAASNILVFPSYREGFPNVPMQAGCLNLPSIVTDINGCNEIVINEVNGLIIPVKDTRALRDAMERLYLDKALYQNITSKARQMITDRYDQPKIWAAILDEYKTHLNNKGFVQNGTQALS